MASKREPSPSLRMRKIALVICEGETEVCYINLLKSWYKSPIRIISHIEGTKITPSLVEKRTKELKISQWDKVHTFLMYDMDVQAINAKLQKCKAEMLLSNPCFEESCSKNKDIVIEHADMMFKHYQSIEKVKEIDYVVFSFHYEIYDVIIYSMIKGEINKDFSPTSTQKRDNSLSLRQQIN